MTIAAGDIISTATNGLFHTVTTTEYPTPTEYDSPLENLMNNISYSATFQTWTGAENHTEALDFIYKNGLPKDTNIATAAPYVIINSGETRTWERIAYGQNDQYDAEGDLQIIFDGPYADDTDDDTQASAQEEKCDQIVSEILQYSGLGGFLAIESIERGETMLPSEQEQYPVITTTYKIKWK